jgi:hypothetical protein
MGHTSRCWCVDTLEVLMSAFADLKQFKDAVLRILGEAPDIRTAKRAIRALPGPSTVHGGVGGMIADDPPIVADGFTIEIIGEIIVRFNDDGSRQAMFDVVVGHGDEARFISVRWVPCEWGVGGGL